MPIGQAPQAIAYLPGAVPEGDGLQGLVPLGLAGQAAQFTLVRAGERAPQGGTSAPTSVTLFDQGLLQVLEASATGLVPRQAYVLALAERADGSGPLQALVNFTANPAGAAIVNAVGPIRQIVQAARPADRRYLVIAPQTSSGTGTPVQIQTP